MDNSCCTLRYSVPGIRNTPVSSNCGPPALILNPAFAAVQRSRGNESSLSRLLGRRGYSTPLSRPDRCNKSLRVAKRRWDPDRAPCGAAKSPRPGRERRPEDPTPGAESSVSAWKVAGPDTVAAPVVKVLLDSRISRSELSSGQSTRHKIPAPDQDHLQPSPSRFWDRDRPVPRKLALAQNPVYLPPRPRPCSTAPLRRRPDVDLAFAGDGGDG